MAKRFFLLAMSALLAVVVRVPADAAIGEAQRVRILASTFPVYLFTRNIASGAEGVVVELMLPASMGCPHDYVLTPTDMEKMGRASIFVVNGLGLEEFLGASLERANPKVVLVDSSLGMADLIQSAPHAHAEKSQQGSRYGHEPGEKAEKGRHEHGHDTEHAHVHKGPNPHLFSSPRMAARMVKNIASGLAKADPSNADRYRRNGASYSDGLDKLAEELGSTVKGLKNRKIVTQHAVFDYLARDGGLEIAAVIQEDPGMEPSAAEMLQLVRIIRKEKVGALFTEPQYSAKVGEAIAREAKIPVAVLDPVATGTEDAPLDYYEQVMRRNLEIMKRVLGSPGS